MVTKEVCLALHKFKTGKQLMILIRDCIRGERRFLFSSAMMLIRLSLIAHTGAVNEAKILHRDVSAGNMLICPTIVRDEKDGKLCVIW